MALITKNAVIWDIHVEMLMNLFSRSLGTITWSLIRRSIPNTFHTLHTQSETIEIDLPPSFPKFPIYQITIRTWRCTTFQNNRIVLKTLLLSSCFFTHYLFSYETLKQVLFHQRFWSCKIISNPVNKFLVIQQFRATSPAVLWNVTPNLSPGYQ